MLSRKQEIQKEKKILLVAKEFLNENMTIKDVASKTGISKSSVQRYLNEKEFLISALGINDYNKIKRLLELNKQEGLSRGGINSQLNYEQVRDENGKYIDNIKK